MSNDLDNGYAVLQTSCIANDVEGKKGCNSSDALTIYEHEGEDGVWYDSYCYSCNQFFNKEQTHNSQAAIELGIKDGEVVEKKKFNPLPKSQPLKKEEVIEFIKKIGYEGKNYRGLKDEYNKFYGHLTKLDSTGKPIARYYPETKDGVVVGYKCRNFPKNFSHGKLGVTGISNDMSGQVKFKSGGRYVLIVGGECYSEDTEVLTPAGWKVFRELSQEDLVMQVEDGVGVFVKPLDYVVKEHNGVLLNYKSKFNDLLVTPKHKMVSLDFNKKEYTHTAEDLPRSKGHSYRKSVWYEGSGVPLTDDQIKFIIAVAADSKVDTRKSGKRVAHFSFIKERKITRLKNLLEKLDLVYTEFDKSVHDWACGRKYHTFNVTLPEWVIEKGLPLNWLQDLNFKQKTLVLDEIILWDGNLVKGRDSFEFSSKLKHEAELVANLAITNNQHANISFRKNDLGEWFVVKVSRNKTTASYQRVIVTEVNYTGKVYCVTVPSGKILVRRNGKVVVCGNCDKVAAYQMLREDQITRKQGEYEAIAVVSPTTGEPSAYKQVASNYEFFDSFDIIVVGMDSDEKGTEAAYAVAKMLPSDKVRIAKWSSKDPNKMLEEGKQKQFVRDFYNAKPFVSVGIKSAADAMSEVSDFLNSPKIGLPPHLHRLQENMRGGIKSTGAIVNIIGHTSIGKTLFTDTLIYDWVFNSPVMPTILSLERTAGELLIDLYSLHLKKNLTWFSDGQDAIDYLDTPEVKVLCENLVYKEDGTPRFYIIDERSASVEVLKKQVDKTRKQNNSNFIICDPLTDFLRSLPLEDQENFMMYQKLLKKDGVVFINVLHTRKPSSDKEGKARDVSEYDVLGSGSFVQSADINIVLNRDKMAENPTERNTTYVSMPKCRGGTTGLACKIYYDPETRQVYDYDDRFNTTPEVSIIVDEDGEDIQIQF